MYQSKLKTLEKLRAGLRDEQLRRVADALRAEQALEQQRQTVDAEMAAARQYQQTLRQDRIDVNSLLATERYELLLKAQAAELANQQRTVAQERERRQVDLAAAQQQLRVIEKIDERRRKAFDQRQLRLEQAVMDELATQQFLRRKRGQQHEV